jgi:hypothetical protein
MKRPTNIQFITSLMEYSDYGALAQCFVFDALIKFADLVAESKAKNYPNCIVPPESWIGVAKEIQGKLNERLKP